MYSLLLVSCFLSLCDYFIDNCIYRHVFLISSEVRQLLDPATENEETGSVDVRKESKRERLPLLLNFGNEKQLNFENFYNKNYKTIK